MYKILEVNQNDRVLDVTCGSGGFLVKAMANMIQEAGGVGAKKAAEVKSQQLYGIEFDREIYALACANMLIHKNGKTNLEQMDARTETAGQWIASKGITKILMNPPLSFKYSWGDSISYKKIVDEIVYLPVKKPDTIHYSQSTTCNPLDYIDFEYMELYMERIMSEIEKKITVLSVS